MILPPAERGYVEQGYGTPMWLHNDARVPSASYNLRDCDAHPLAAYRGACERHLFDVIEVARDVETELPNGEWKVEQEFSARLTCVRCGVIVAWEGTRDGEGQDPRAVDPVPLVVGDLAAQMIDGGRDGVAGDRDWSTWAIHRGAERIGVITWARGPRGRDYFTARLFAWPDGEKVEAATPVAVLRKVARAAAVATAS